MIVYCVKNVNVLQCNLFDIYFWVKVVVLRTFKFLIHALTYTTAVIEMLDNRVDEESICLYINRMHDDIQNLLSSNNRNVDDVQNRITIMRDNVIRMLNNRVDEECICLYITAMHYSIQDHLLPNIDNVYDVDMYFDIEFDDEQLDDEVRIEFIDDCVLRKECQCFAR